METSKCVAIIGLILQGAAAVPPFILVWYPEETKFEGEVGIPTRFIEKLSAREKCLLTSGLVLLLAGTILQTVALCLQN